MNRIQEAKYMLLIVCISLAISLTLSHSLFNASFIEDGEAVITITNLAQRSDSSWGTDCRIQGIKVNGISLSLNQIQAENEWNYEDNNLVSLNPALPTSLFLNIKDGANISIDFIKQFGSGLTEVFYNDKSLGIVDLYADEWMEYEWSRALPVTVNIFDHLILFIIMTFSVTVIIYITHRCVVRIVNGKKEGALWADRAILLTKILLTAYFLLAIGYLWFFEGSDPLSLIIGCEKLIAFSLFAWLLLIYSYRFINSYLSQDQIGKVISNTSFCLTPIIMFGIAEYITGNQLFSLGTKFIIGNMIVYYFLYSLLYLLVGNIRVVFYSFTGCVTLFTIVNYYVTKFRGTPLIPGDFLVFETAKGVFTNYSYSISWRIYSGLIVLITCWVLVGNINFSKKKYFSVKRVVTWSGITIMGGALLFQSSIFSQQLDLWNLNYNIQNYGLAYSFITNLRQLFISEPEDYSYAKVGALYNDNKSTPNSRCSKAPHVIAIMNEAFSDLKTIGDFKTSEEYMPFIDSISENVIKGKALVSVLGGGTSNSEFEFLTGNSMAFLPIGSIPYQQYVTKKRDSLATILKQQGYQTIAIHPYYGAGYNREKDYPLLGLDTFLDIEDFENPTLARNRYISDQSSYQKVIEQYESLKEKGPLFIFNVTMQNHSGYNYNFYESKDRVRLIDFPGEFPDVEEYLTLVKQSDNAFKELVAYFKEVDAPVIILMFGDHQPNLDNKFYEKLYAKDLSTLTLEEQQRRYTVPFVIWANYDIESQTNVISSTNFLSTILLKASGVKATPYNSFLDATDNFILGMNVNGYYGDDNQWHSYTEANDFSTYLTNYRMVQYNNLFSGKRLDAFFEVN